MGLMGNRGGNVARFGCSCAFDQDGELLDESCPCQADAETWYICGHMEEYNERTTANGQAAESN